MLEKNLTDFVDELEGLKKEGEEVLPTDALIEHLKCIAESPNMTPEQLNTDWQMRHEASLESYRAEVDTQGRLLDATIRLGEAALKSAILINGGAAVAVLAYLGNMQSKSIEVGSMPDSLCSFVFGVLFAALGTGVGYLCQFCYTEELFKWAKRFHLATVGVIILSYILFARGALVAYAAF